MVSLHMFQQDSLNTSSLVIAILINLPPFQSLEGHVIDLA